MNNRIVLCVLLFSGTGHLFSASDFTPVKVVENDQQLSTGGCMATGAWLAATALIGYRVAGTDNLLKKEALEHSTRARLEKINAGEHFHVADLHHELKLKFYAMKRQSTIVGAKRAVCIPVGLAGLYMLGQGTARMCNQFLDAALRVAENHQKAKINKQSQQA